MPSIRYHSLAVLAACGTQGHQAVFLKNPTLPCTASFIMIMRIQEIKEHEPYVNGLTVLSVARLFIILYTHSCS